jgi:ATP-dependent helicase/nuclease subunit A
VILADQDAREAIRKDLGVNMLVEAAAGTGKTTSLVTRIASLIASGACEIDRIAAITFTVKAAAQLREKLQEALEKALRLSGAGAEHDRLTKAIHSLDRAFIGTTHAFCARLLRERPVEAGLDPEFEELDEVAAALRLHAFWGQWFDAQAALGSEALRNVVEAGVKPKHLRAAFVRLVEYADVEMVSTPCSKPELRPAVEEVLKFLARCEPSFPDDTMRQKRDGFEVMMRALVRKRDSSDLGDALEQLAFLEEGNHVTAKATLKNWPDKAHAKQLYLDYRQLASALVRPAVTRWREYVHCLVLDFLTPAVRAYEAQRMRDGLLSFSDLLLRARDLLRDHPAVRQYFQRRFERVLVDEFQDTDPIQAEVLFYLTGAEVAEKNWRQLTPRPGSLFIVGDPKQSIYRFRRADITTYRAVRSRIEATGGRVVPLSTNFRSPASICEFVNGQFRVLFSEADVKEGMQAEHVDLVAAESPSSQTTSSSGAAVASTADPLEASSNAQQALSGVFVLETQDANVMEVAEAEAACIAQWIRASVAAGTHRYGDFLLVSDRKQRLHVYASALEREGIRYEVTGGEAFSQSEDLRNAMPLLRAIADPDDPVALAAFLRGPLCGASDDALYRYVKGGGRWSAWHQGENVPAEVGAGLDVVREGIEAARVLPPAAAIARIFERAGIITSAASEDEGGTRAGNALLALALARRESADGAGFAEVTAYLGDLLESKAKIEELDVDPAAADVVRLMNLHQVKGLEAPVVFLIDPVDDYEPEPDLFVDRSGETSRGYVAIRESWGRKPRPIALPQGWDTLATREKEFHAAERKRLLYVAATRARRMLVAGVRMTTKGRGGIWSALVQNVKALLPALTLPVRAGGLKPAASLSPEEAKLAIEARLDQARAASYSVLPITKIAHDDHVELVRAEEGLGKGTSWGRVLHRLFEALVRRPSLDVRAFAENLLKDEERDPVEVGEVLEVVRAVQGSPLWARIQNADERLVEVPFALMADVAPHGETLLHGVIDLVFREGATWYVVDYKTDSTLGRLDALVAYYRPQVEHYARFWSQLTGAETRAGLFFVDSAEAVWVMGSAG